MHCISWISKHDSKGHLSWEPQRTSPWNRNPGWILKLLETGNLFSPTFFPFWIRKSTTSTICMSQYCFWEQYLFLDFHKFKDRESCDPGWNYIQSLTSTEMMRLNFRINETRCKSRLRCIFGLDLTRDQIANICWIIEKAREFRKKHLFLLYWLRQSLWQCGSQ